MSFVEIDLFGVLIPPLVPLIVLAFAITLTLSWLAVESGWTPGPSSWRGRAPFDFEGCDLRCRAHR